MLRDQQQAGLCDVRIMKRKDSELFDLAVTDNYCLCSMT